MLTLHSIFPLPEVEDPHQVSTLGEHIAAGHQIRARCTHVGCNYNMSLNLVVVARYLGPSHFASATDLKPYFYCPSCREAGLEEDRIEFLHYPPTAPFSHVSVHWVADRTAA